MPTQMPSVSARRAAILSGALLIVAALLVACSGPPTGTPAAGGTPAATAPAQTAAPVATGRPSPAVPTPYPGPSAHPAPASPAPALPTRVATAYPGPSPAPSPARTPTPAVSPTATPPIACGQEPVRGFGKLWREQAPVAVRIGCPKDREVGMPAAEQTFERGLMLWRGDTGEVYVLRQDGTWSAYKDTWKEGEPNPTVGAPPAGLAAPVGRFGKVWREQAGVRDQLGWATGAARSYQGAVEGFANGAMFWSDARVIYVLYADGKWQRFQDTFTG